MIQTAVHASSPVVGELRPSAEQTLPDPSRLAPEDAFYTQSPPRQPTWKTINGIVGDDRANGSTANGLSVPSKARLLAHGSKKRRDKDRGRSGSRRKHLWKKLLWVKQSYPDNYTDEDTFLDHLQRNPRLQPYEFWPLVADSTVIVQQVCSVIIFACCFVGIFQERVSPVSVVTFASLGTVIGWILWDWWVGQEESEVDDTLHGESAADDGSNASSTGSFPSDVNLSKSRGSSSSIGLTFQANHKRNPSGTSMQSGGSATSPTSPTSNPGIGLSGGGELPPPPPNALSSFSPRNQRRIATAKSAILIYCALLGLSPILKSLTKSTTSDSIWAMSCWLMCINVFFFDYGGDVGVKYPASFSTNAALMASTVLASRLPSTTHVFSLTLFSIEVFGLFPVFRRYLRHWSWHGHLVLTGILVLGASGGFGVTISGGGWKAAFAGVILGGVLTGLTMGICSWWLIGLQKYKNEIRGPWDPARPIIRRDWD